VNVPTQDQVREALQSVMDPELGRNMVELGLTRSIAVSAEGRVDVTVALDAPGCAPRAHFDRAVKQRVASLEGVRHVNVHFAEPKPATPPRGPQPKGQGAWRSARWPA
jgi:ATP-binding protein involved in chromosome partitioning